MKKFLFVLFLVLLAAVTYVGVNKFAPKIEANITERVNQALNESLLDTNITAEVTGRDVTLRGNVDTAENREQAAMLAGRVLGVRSVENNINVAGVEVDVQQIIPFDPTPAPIIDMSFDLNEQTPDMPQPDLTENGTEDVFIAPAPIEMEMAEIDVPQPATIVPDEENFDTSPIVKMPQEPKEPEEIVQPSQTQPESFEAAEMAEEVVQEVAQEDVIITDACEEKLASLISAEKINFDTGSATIKSSSYALLDKIVAEAKKCDDSTIQVHGHTDASGNKATNRLLSHARAKSVGRYLLTKGVAKEVRIFGHGANMPIADNATEEGRAKNRRIEFKVVKK